MRRPMLIVFLTLSAASITARLLGGFPGYAFFKATPIWLLAFFVFRVRGSRLILLGLLFGSAGDVALSLDFAQSFVVGLALFLVGHLFYAAEFWLHFRFRTGRLVLALLPVLAGFGLAIVLSPQLGNFALPVYLYVATILTMVVGSVFRDGPLWPLYAGSCVFMLSDSLIAVNKFLFAIPLAALWILGSYYPAQLLIALGAMRRLER